jgi:F-type H+-transporting ATPase subunit delta
VSESLVARRYGTALLELGVESGDLDRLVRELEAASLAYDTSPELKNAVENPLVPHVAKKAVLGEVADRLGLGGIAKNTLQLLVDRRRMKALPYIARYLREASDKKRGVVRAVVTTAAPLPEDYYVRLQRQLEALTGQKVSIEKKEDPSLIGGVVTRIGDRVFDGSIKTRLQSLRDALMPN